MKSLQDCIFESNRVDCTEYFKDKNLKDIPIDANTCDDPEIYIGQKFNKFLYFGNCVNTVPSIWDATQMSHFCLGCKLYDINLVINNLKDGDKKIPIVLIKNLNSKNINDLNEIVCAMDDYQKIMFIYIAKLDKHFFFDCKL